MNINTTLLSHRYFARVPRGLEDLAWADLESLGNFDLLATSHRLLEFDSTQPVSTLLSLQSVEDIFLYAGEVSGIGKHRTALSVLSDVVRWSNFDELLAVNRGLKRQRSIRFSITASFLGKRNYNRWEIADVIGAALTKKFGWHYISLERPVQEPVDIHLRLHIEDERALFGARLGATPLYKRSYKEEHSKGSLNPCVAYLMTQLARNKQRTTLIDPACGVGTIPLEAMCAGWQQTIGYDIDPIAIEKAQINAKSFANIKFETRDFLASGSRNNTADAVVTDLPWGAQTTFHSQNHISPSLILDSLWSLTHKDGVVIIMTEHDQPIIDEAIRKGFHIQQAISLSLYGRHPVIIVIEQ